MLSIEKFIPSLSFIQSYAVWIILYIAVVAFLVGFLKARFNVRTAYTRKIFHFFIFTAAAVLQFLYGLQATVLLGVLVMCLILFAVSKSEESNLYKALARDSDQPYATRFIVLPLLATAAGGVLSNAFFPAFAFVGYLVGGWGDAIGEPVGSKWGKHKYQVPTLFGVKATRSLEGSLAVSLVSVLICFGVFSFLSYTTQTALIYALIVAFCATLTEAFSSHGLDNLTMQFVTAMVSTYLLT
jgi:phytol kinase